MNDFDADMIQSMRQKISQKSDLLFNKAEQLVDEFFRVRNDYLDRTKGKPEFRSPHLGCRVTRNKNSPGITIAWFHYEYYGQKGKRGSNTNHIKLNSAGTYSESKIFDWRTLDWEKDMFRKLDPDLQKIREESRQLGKLSVSVSRFERSLERINEKPSDVKEAS